MNDEVLMTNTEEKDKEILREVNNFYYRVIIGEDKDINLENTDIIANDKRELEILYYTLGDNMTTIIDNEKEASYKDLLNNSYKNPASESFEWNYRDPKEAHNVITKISMPDCVIENLSGDIKPIQKQYVHKVNENNVMISYPERVGNMLYFRGFKETDELRSDHSADHLDGIKLFEVVRQTTLASFHVMGVPFGKIMVLTTTRLDFNKLIELDKPYFIQVIPACRTDGGAMFSAFNVIQDGESHASGYIGAYTFRSKEAYESKRGRK